MKHMLRKTAALALALCLTVALAGIALGADGGKKGVLLVAFGTSMDTGAPAYEGIEGAFRKTGEPVVWAFTSNIIRAKMAKQGVKLLTVPEGLAKLADEGVTDVTVQSLHIMAGEEYAKMERLVLTDVLAHPDRFASVKVGRPLVESMRDARDVAEAVLHSLPAARSADDAVLLMAHGQGEGRCDMVFAGMKDVVNDTDPLAFMASVEGYQGIDQVLPELQAKGAKRVWLLPLSRARAKRMSPAGRGMFLPCSMRLTQRLSLRIFLASAYCVRPRFRRSPTTISPNDTFFSSIRCLIHGPCNFDR